MNGMVVNEKEWLKCTHFEMGGKLTLMLEERYVILVVMKGRLSLHFNSMAKHIGERMMLVVDRNQLTDVSCVSGTVLVEYTPPEKIFRYFACCSLAFSIPCSTIVPLELGLDEWADELTATSLDSVLCTEADKSYFCFHLAAQLKKYPPLVVGELLVPFKACGMNGKDCMCNL